MMFESLPGHSPPAPHLKPCLATHVAAADQVKSPNISQKCANQRVRFGRHGPPKRTGAGGHQEATKENNRKLCEVSKNARLLVRLSCCLYGNGKPTVSVRGGKNSSDWNRAPPSIASASLALAWMRSMILGSGSEVMV